MPCAAQPGIERIIQHRDGLSTYRARMPSAGLQLKSCYAQIPVGEERSRQAHVWRSYVDQDVVDTDVPVENASVFPSTKMG